MEQDDSRLVLLKNLTTLFNDEELHDLCYRLSIDYEDLPGFTKSGKARELINYFERRNEFQKLIGLCEVLRPDATWPHPSPKVLPQTNDEDSAKQSDNLLQWLISKNPTLIRPSSKSVSPYAGVRIGELSILGCIVRDIVITIGSILLFFIVVSLYLNRDAFLDLFEDPTPTLTITRIRPTVITPNPLDASTPTLTITPIPPTVITPNPLEESTPTLTIRSTPSITATSILNLILATCTCEFGNVPLFGAPDSSSAQVGVYVEAGDIVVVLGRATTGSWIYVEFEGKKGWVDARLFTIPIVIEQIAVAETPFPTWTPTTNSPGLTSTAISNASVFAYWQVTSTSSTGDGRWKTILALRVPRGGSYAFGFADLDVTFQFVRQAENGFDLYDVTISGMSCAGDLVGDLIVKRNGQQLTVRNEHTNQSGAVFVSAPDC